MNIAEIIPNDIADSDNGICVSLWFSGCSIRCKGCHNSHLWEPKETMSRENVIDKLSNLLQDNKIERSLSILGGEPLESYNRSDCAYVCKQMKQKIPNLFIRLWTGLTWKQVQEQSKSDKDIKTIISNCNQMITGPYIQELRDLNLKLRGSSNQEIINLEELKIETEN